jgi:hypothetical protein
MQVWQGSLVLLLVVLDLGCRDPHCPPSQVRLVNRCYPKLIPTSDSGQADSAISDRTTDGDVEAAVPPAGPSSDSGFVGLDASAHVASDTGLLPVPATCVPTSESCDGQDNDCDGLVDDGLSNECGGPCAISVGTRPGTPCSNGGIGACARDGTFVCQGPSTACSAAAVAPTTEVCDGADNDCNGMTDEAAPTWFQDCDGDGFAASTLASIKSCTKPASAGTCLSWTTTIPSPETHANWDCNDADAAYRPGADYGFPPDRSGSYDLDCDGIASYSPTYDPDFGDETKVCRAKELEDVATGICPSVPCRAWKDSANKLGSRPVSFCPDFPGTVHYVMDDFGQSCSFTITRVPQWPCR